MCRIRRRRWAGEQIKCIQEQHRGNESRVGVGSHRDKGIGARAYEQGYMAKGIGTRTKGHGHTSKGIEAKAWGFYLNPIIHRGGAN